MDARSVILERISSSLGRTGRLNAEGYVPITAPAPEVPHAYRTASDLSTERLIEIFADRLADYNAGVARVSAAELPATVARLLDEADDIVIPADLDRAWVGEFAGRVLTDSREEPQPVDVLNAVGAVVTGSTTAIADTGTICLSGPHCGRRAITLVPDHHVCVVRAADIVDIVPQAVARLQEAGLSTAPQTWASGPSATVDIEFERVAGVHGPRRLDVVIVVDEDEPEVHAGTQAAAQADPRDSA